MESHQVNIKDLDHILQANNLHINSLHSKAIKVLQDIKAPQDIPQEGQVEIIEDYFLNQSCCNCELK